MHRNLSHHRSIIRYGMIALLVAVAAASTARAQAPTEQTRQITVIHDLAPVGLADGQSFRISVPNPLPPAAPGEDGEKYKMLFAVTLFTADGRVIARSNEITLDPGQFHLFDFKRPELPLAGEPGTGRLQVRAQVRQRFFPGIAARISQGKFPGAVELIDDSTGRTTVSYGGGVNELTLNDTPGKEELNPNGFQIISAGSNDMIGIAPGQTLRVTVSDPNLPDQSGHPTGYKALVCIFIADGKQIARSEEIAIPAGGFHSFDFKRADLLLAGEAGTGRLQVRAQVRYRPFQLLDRTRAIGFPVSLELIDNSTGRTTAVWVTLGFFEVVPPAKPE